MPQPSLPPAYHLIVLDPKVVAFERAVRAAPRGIEDGTVYWTARPDRLDMALVLEPETTTLPALDAVYLLTIAAFEALAPLVPPAVPMACAWPGDLLLADARAGGIRVALAPTADPAAAPPWLVLGLRLQLADAPGELDDCTSLASQGAPEVTTTALLNAVTSHFLHWTRSRRTEGPASVYAAWNRRCFRRGQPGVLALNGQPVTGTIGGLDAEGRFTIGQVRLPLTEALELLG